MNLLTLDNPVFVAYLIAASLIILKLTGHGWLTVYGMLSRKGGFLNPEDANRGLANPEPREGQLDANEFVERTRRMHRNDLENAPAFLAAGLLFVLIEPSLLVAQLLFFGFVGTRLLHAIAYATGRSHEVRATFYTVGSFIVIGMAVMTLLAAFH